MIMMTLLDDIYFSRSSLELRRGLMYRGCLSHNKKEKRTAFHACFNDKNFIQKKSHNTEELRWAKGGGGGRSTLGFVSSGLLLLVSQLGQFVLFVFPSFGLSCG